MNISEYCVEYVVFTKSDRNTTVVLNRYISLYRMYLGEPSKYMYLISLEQMVRETV